MSGYIMDFDHFVRGCAPCPKLGGVRFVSLYWGGGGKIVEIWYWKGRGCGEGNWGCFCTLPWLD